MIAEWLEKCRVNGYPLISKPVNKFYSLYKFSCHNSSHTENDKIMYDAILAVSS